MSYWTVGRGLFLQKEVTWFCKRGLNSSSLSGREERMVDWVEGEVDGRVSISRSVASAPVWK